MMYLIKTTITFMCTRITNEHFVALGSNLSNLGLRFWIKQAEPNTPGAIEKVSLHENKQ